MLAARSVSRLAAPLVSRQLPSAATTVPRHSHTLRSATAAFSSCATLVAAVKPLTAATASSHSHSHSSGGSHSAAAHAAAGLSPAAVAAVAVAAVGLISYALSESVESGELSSSSSESLRVQLRSWASRYGLSAAECDAAAAEVRSNLIQSTRGPSAVTASALPPVPADVFGEDVLIAPVWRRMLAAIIDQLVAQGILMIATLVLGKLRPGVDFINTSEQSVAASVLMSFLIDLISLLRFNGRTPGKWATGTRVVRADSEPLNLNTALLQSFSRMLLAPLAFVAEPMPLLFSSSCREQLQLTHNAIAGTIVIVEERSQKQ